MKIYSHKQVYGQIEESEFGLKEKIYYDCRRAP